MLYRSHCSNISNFVNPRFSTMTAVKFLVNNIPKQNIFYRYTGVYKTVMNTINRNTTHKKKQVPHVRLANLSGFPSILQIEVMFVWTSVLQYFLKFWRRDLVHQVKSREFYDVKMEFLSETISILWFIKHLNVQIEKKKTLCNINIIIQLKSLVIKVQNADCWRFTSI